MFLTVYYMAATLLQSYRLRQFLSRVAKQLNERVSIAFYNQISANDEEAAPVSSELCANQREARIVDVLWHHGHQRGCTIRPVQKICISPWISFPNTPKNIPIRINSPQTVEETIADPIYVLVEAQFAANVDDQLSEEERDRSMDHSNSLEEFGDPVAWRADVNFSFLLRTSKEQLLKFILASFLANNLAINDDLQILRIQSVDVDGDAQPFESIKQHIKKDVFEMEPKIRNNPQLRQKYMALLNDLCFLAHQAAEFDSERARHSNKPDLIAHSRIESPKTEEKNTVEPVEAVESREPKRKPLQRTNRSEGSFIASGKPPNILVYSESSITRDNTMAALQTVLKPDTYTVYQLTPSDLKNRVWQENTRLLVVCGPISAEGEHFLLEFYLKRSGNMLCLCSDLLHVVVANYRTAEVREQELAHFSYSRWQKVPMMHHIFCYQPSPIKKHFSHDSDDAGHTPNTKLACPKSVEVTDAEGGKYPVDVQILGVEDTWRTPSIILAINRANNSRAIFSQVHLEVDPSQFESNDERKYEVLKGSNCQRLEILSDLLANHLNMEVRREFSAAEIQYTAGYLLADPATKSQFLLQTKGLGGTSGCLSAARMNLQFVSSSQMSPQATDRFLPIHMDDASPPGFDRAKYFAALTTEKIGRLVIYVPVVTSSMDVLDKLNLVHGVVVIPKYQTNGSGRSKNKWLSADGCLMFTVQLHVNLSSVLGQRIPLVQHLMATAVVNAIISEDGYQDLDLGIKWPNDIYANGCVKIGGLIVSTTIEGANAVCNVGVGLNLDNASPTTCINELIRDLNRTRTESPLKTFDAEVLFAKIFNELERLLVEMEQESERFTSLYYQLWLHENQNVQVKDQSGAIKAGTVTGIDDYGYLKVTLSGLAGRREVTVHPDGNSFDMLRGLIMPKFN